MAESNSNPLDPTLELLQTTEDQKYVYLLTVEVANRCIIDKPQITVQESENEVNLIIFYSLFPDGATCKEPKVILKIDQNPEGLPGEITVLIQESRTTAFPPNYYSPMADGKSIIRFEKAKSKSNSVEKSAAFEKSTR